VKKQWCSEGECKITKIKNKRQGTMTKGIEAPVGSERGGLISGGQLPVLVTAGNGGSQGPQP